jgi:hypothetical protein
MFPDSPVKKFDTLVLRADYNNSWIHREPSGRARAQRTRDSWMKDSHRAMGWTAGHNRFLHLFLDGFSISSAGAGSIYFTTNGVDPRVYGSVAVSPHAILYTNPLAIHSALQVEARVWKDAPWSTLVEATVTNSLTRGIE